uniref:Uncharacterized protein n=1 Tax=Romanomermis culicivorax TaxID=13658 RepID=A0A915J3A4_ROMCU
MELRALAPVQKISIDELSKSERARRSAAARNGLFPNFHTQNDERPKHVVLYNNYTKDYGYLKRQLYTITFLVAFEITDEAVPAQAIPKAIADP